MSILHLEKENFNEIINDGLTLVDFYAEWCGPCKMLGPIIEEVSNQVSNVKIIKINVDEHSNIAQKYGVMSIPTLIMFKDGQEIDKTIGFMTKEDMIEFINKNSN
ncbi:MAG: thioredoxin [Firmicutes bacterium]|nr:thioredoxin [Bacillota bacterium]